MWVKGARLTVQKYVNRTVREYCEYRVAYMCNFKDQNWSTKWPFSAVNSICLSNRISQFALTVK